MSGDSAVRESVLRGLVLRIRDADVSTMAAAVAYNTFLAIVPLAFAALGAAAFVGQDEAALERLDSILEVLAPRTVADYVIGLLNDAEARVGGQHGWLILGSVLFALFMGSRAVVALQKALAAVENRTERRPALQMRLVGVALTIAGGAALVVTSILLVSGRHLIDVLVEWTGVDALGVLWTWLRIPVAAASLFLFLLAFYRWGPPQPLEKPWLAALVAGGGALLVSLGFGLYLAMAPSLGATFGTLGAVAVAMVWLYLGSFMILLGAVVVAYVLRVRVAGAVAAPATTSGERDDRA
jgi:membrane protein